MPSRVFVLLAAYNGATWIEQQLASVLCQRGVDVTVHVFDDRSTDQSADLVRAMAEKDARIKLTTNAVASGSAGANFKRAIRSADIAEASYVAFCDQDDVWKDDKLEIACQTLDRTEAALYSCSVTAVWPDGSSKRLSQSAKCQSHDYLFEGAGQGCTFVLTKSFFQRVQTFISSHQDEVAVIHYHDWLVYALARVWAYRWVYDPKSHLDYRQHSGNDTGARGRFSGVTRRATLICSGWYARQVVGIMNVCSIATNGSTGINAVRTKMQASRNSGGRRFLWSWYLFREGRRRLLDRVVLCAAAAFGFL